MERHGRGRRQNTRKGVKQWPLPNGKDNPNAPTKADRRVVMGFLQDRHLLTRCLHLGWHDITAEWFAMLNGPKVDVAELGGPQPRVPEAATPTAEQTVAEITPAARRSGGRTRAQEAPAK